MDDPTAVADLLEGAADTLFISGRCIGEGRDTDGRMCVRGAIAHQLGADPLAVWGARDTLGDAFLAIDGYLAEHPELIDDHVWEVHGGTDRFPSWIWNDTTHGPDGDALVIDTLRRCAKQIRNNQGCCPSDPQVADGEVAA